MMIIECNTCRARFRLDESRITGRGARVRCRKCGDAIVVLKPAGPSSPPSIERGENTLDLRTLLRQPPGEPPRDARSGDAPSGPPPGSEPVEAPKAARPSAGQAPSSAQAAPGGDTPSRDPSGPANGRNVPGGLEASAFAPPDATEDKAEDTPAAPAEPHADKPGASPADPAPPAPAPLSGDAEAFFERFLPSPEERPEEEPAAVRDQEPPPSGAEEAHPAPPLAAPGDSASAPAEASASAAAAADGAHPSHQPSSAASGPGGLSASASPPGHAPASKGLTEGGTEGGAEHEPAAAAAEAGPAPAPGFTIDFAPEERLDLSAEIRAGISGEGTAWSAPEPAPPAATARDGERPDRRYDISGNIRLCPNDVDVPAAGDRHPGTGTLLSFPDDTLRKTSSRAEELQKELRHLEDLTPSTPPVPPLADAAPPPPRAAVRMPAAAPSRRRGREARPRSRVGLLFVLFLVLAGGGAYLGFTESGRGTLNTLLSQAEALRSSGRRTAATYTVGNLIGYYESTSQAGRIFVVKGQVTNTGRASRSGIRIQAALLDGREQEIARKTVYAGNVLGGEALRQTSREAIESELANRFGSNLINMDVASGSSVPFMVVFFDAPDGIEAYRIEAQDAD